MNDTEQLTRILFLVEYPEHNEWDIQTIQQQCPSTYIKCLKEAVSIIQAGWVSPEEIARQDQRWVDSEKILNSEASFEEKRLHSEVEYWKGKNYRLG